jgi:beta propeller repeat protein
VETRITTHPSAQYRPAISGDRFVWQDNRNGNWDIYMFDLATGVEAQITTDPNQQLSPAISGDRIVWEDSRSGRRDIFMFDLATSAESQITTAPFSQAHPAIAGDQVVWEDFRNGNWDIYLFEFATEPVEIIQVIKVNLDRLVADGSIRNSGIVESLQAFLSQAESHIVRENTDAAVITLTRFIDQVGRQTPQNITGSAAQTLIDMVQAVIDGLSA